MCVVYPCYLLRGRTTDAAAVLAVADRGSQSGRPAKERRLDQDCEPLTFLSEVGQLTRAGRRESQLLCRAGPRARQPCCRWGRGGAGAGPGPGRMSEVGTSNGAL